MIREIEYHELEEASRVLWKSFYEAEKENHSISGMERFRDLTSPVSLSMNTFDGVICLYGYYEDGALLAVGALREKKHVMMLYVLPNHQGRGIGRKLLSFMESRCDQDEITLNSSDCGMAFYKKQGYCVVGGRTVQEELIFTPMKKIKKA